MGVYKNCIEPFLFQRLPPVCVDTATTRSGTHANTVQPIGDIVLKNSNGSSDLTREGYMKFENASTGQAVLRLYWDTDPVTEANTLDVYAVGNNWSSSTITFANAPSAPASPVASLPIPIGMARGWKDIPFDNPAPGTGSFKLAMRAKTAQAYVVGGVTGNAPVLLHP